MYATPANLYGRGRHPLSRATIVGQLSLQTGAELLGEPRPPWVEVQRRVPQSRLIEKPLVPDRMTWRREAEQLRLTALRHHYWQRAVNYTGRNSVVNFNRAWEATATASTVSPRRSLGLLNP